MNLFLGDFQVLSGSLTSNSLDDIKGWEQVAYQMEYSLPGWIMRLHYNSSNFYDRDLRQDVMSGGGLCSLRARHNVELVDMFSSTLATDWWPYTPILDGDATAAAVSTMITVTPNC